MSVFLNEEVSLKISYVFKKLKEIIENSKNSISSKKEKVLFKTDIQACLNYKFEDALEESIKKIIIDHAFKAEQLSPGSFKETILISNDLLMNENRNEHDVKVSFHPKLEDLKKIIDVFSTDEVVSALCFEAINLSGFGGKISIEKSLNSETSVELIDGYSFKHDNLGIHPIKIKKPRIICIDGYIESVSEANLLFEGAVQLKHPLILVCRGMSDEVLQTIKVNKDRKTMFIYPIKIPFDLQGINTIADISTVIGLNPVSCNLGDLISATKIEDSVEIDEIFITGNSLIIKNSKTRKNVNLHLRSLIEKRHSSNVDVEELLTVRIKSLSNNCVIIRLPNDSKYVSTSQSIDYVLRSVKSMLDYGIFFDNNKIKLYGSRQFSIDMSKKLYSLIKNIHAFLE
jgi:chaperonin GroEL (HSP60 family)